MQIAIVTEVVKPQIPPIESTGLVHALADEALGHRGVRHPYLAALAGAELPDLRWALADFARHYSGYVLHFRRYLCTLIARLDDPRHWGGLLENLAEESGTYDATELAELARIGIEPEWIVGVPHPSLFRRFCVALEVEQPKLGEEAEAVVRWRERFLQLLSRGSPSEAVGALGLGTENVVRTIYAPLSAALERLPGLTPRETVFFPLHTAVDDHHTQTLQAIAEELAATEGNAERLRRGMLEALALRCEFWDWLYARALDPTRAR